MALTKITYTNKVALSPQPSIAAENKVTDSDMNEIKSVVNDAIDKIESPQTTTTTSDYDTYSCNYINTLVEYSTSEINTGKKWIDGKPIYRKCFSQNDLSNIATGITNIDSLIKMECLVQQTSTNDWRNLPWLFSGGQASWQGGFFYKASDSSISFQVGTDLGQVQKAIVILEYTKTTD